MMSPTNSGSPAFGEFHDEVDDRTPLTHHGGDNSTAVSSLLLMNENDQGTRRRAQQQPSLHSSSPIRLNGHSPSQVQQFPFQSQSRGGYGQLPVMHGNGNGSLNNKSDKYHGRKLSSRIMAAIVNFPREWGCSADEMLRGEGELGEYYRDDFNDESWSCSFGTSEENGIWMNTTDQPGTIMAFMVWFLLSYSALTMLLLTEEGGLPPSWSMFYSTLCAMALACHAKTSLSDPGSIPQSAMPQEDLRNTIIHHAMCSQCQTFKPPMSHHCRICNRCVSKMDHHCPWMNNCVGAGNLKHFILFLMYTWLCSTSSLLMLGWSYFYCAADACKFHLIVVELVRVMLLLCLGAFIFTSSMLMNVCYGLMTGIGTIDRLKKKAQNTMSESDEEPIPLKNVFGIAGYHTWPFPIDPVFEDYDVVMEFSTPQRLLREQLLRESSSFSDQLTASVVDDDVYNV